MTIDWAVLSFLMTDMMGEPPWYGQNWDLGMRVGVFLAFSFLCWDWRAFASLVGSLCISLIGNSCLLTYSREISLNGILSVLRYRLRIATCRPVISGLGKYT